MQKEYNLYITLGHNSSAIAYIDNECVVGYEEERLDRKKSSSAFPKKAIAEILNYFPASSNYKQKNIFVSHWFDDYNFHEHYDLNIAKYWDYDYIKFLKEKYNFNIFSLHKNFTHHDAHAHSATIFFENHCTKPLYDKINNDIHIIVSDGFGNKEEVISIYRIENDVPKLINRVYGYKNSLGLLYQYATSYCGMKENEDEYKFLGYESKINDLINVDYDFIIKQADLRAKLLFENINSTTISNNEKFIDINKLKETKEYFHAMFDGIFYEIYSEKDFYPFEIPSPMYGQEKYYKRVVIGTYIQRVIEKYYELLIEYYNIENVILTGGLHYNVKLNNHVLKKINGYICVPPLAGDQGAAIGFAEDTFPYNKLDWGYRRLKRDEYNYLLGYFSHNNDFLYQTEFFGKEEYYKFLEFVITNLSENKIVQVVTGNMEFGPRALCNTSTLALATEENVKLINNINDRNTVMPMAPVCTYKIAREYFDNNHIDRIIGSTKYMIITCDYKSHEHIDKIRGVMHNYPNFNNNHEELFSGRPQIVGNGYICEILHNIGLPIINTSYNYHGSPINFSMNNCFDDFKKQYQKLPNDKKKDVFLVFYNEKE